MPRGGWAWLGAEEPFAASLAMVPSMFGELPVDGSRGTARALYGTGRWIARGLGRGLRRRSGLSGTKQPSVHVQPRGGFRVELTRHRKLLSALVLRERRARPRTDGAVDRARGTTEIAERPLGLANELRPPSRCARFRRVRTR